MKRALLAMLIAGSAQAADADNGRKILENRALSACLLCHSGPFPAPHLQGNIGPKLDGVGARLSIDELRQRLVNPEKFNSDTVMPSYATIEPLNRVGTAWRGRPILTPAQIEDVVVYLATLR